VEREAGRGPVALGVWLHKTHAIPLRICRTASDPGFGYHSMFPAWSTSGTACPGKARITQFREVVFPGIVAGATGTPTEEDDVALTTDDINKIASAVAVKLIAGGGVLEASDVTRVAAAVAAKPVAPTVAQIQAIATSPALAENIAEKVAAKLATRLAN
jgi:hypothetical protein